MAEAPAATAGESLEARLGRLEQRLEFWGSQLSRELRELAVPHYIAGRALSRGSGGSGSGGSRPTSPHGGDGCGRPRAGSRSPSRSRRGPSESRAPPAGDDGAPREPDFGLAEAQQASAPVLQTAPTPGTPGKPEEPPLPPAEEGRVSLTQQTLQKSRPSMTMSGKRFVSEKDVHPARQWLRQMLLTVYFDYAIGTVIFFNAVLIGVQVNHEATSSERVGAFFTLELVCIAIFTLELALRFIAFDRRICEVFGYVWTAFDFSLVLISLVDLGLRAAIGDSVGSGGTSVGKILKIIRMARILRVLRMLRFLSDLRVMLSMVINSLMSLFWLLVFLVMILYAFSTIITRGVTDYIDEFPNVALSENLSQLYGSLFDTMYTLFKCMTGGINWGVAADPMLEIGAFYFGLFIVFMCFTIFCVLNLVTGVMVDGAIELSKHDRSILLDKEAKAREAAAGHLLELLQQIDADGNGTISRAEFVAALNNQSVVQFMEALQIDTHEALDFYEILDRDGDDAVDVEEWVEGMRRLKGEARSADIAKLRAEVKALGAALIRQMETGGYSMSMGPLHLQGVATEPLLQLQPPPRRLRAESSQAVQAEARDPAAAAAAGAADDQPQKPQPLAMAEPPPAKRGDHMESADVFDVDLVFESVHR